MNADQTVRRLRGAVSIASLWSIAWLAVGAAISVVVPLEGSVATIRLTVASMVLWGMWGACSGLAYAACIALEHVHSIRQLSSRRALMWGALSGVVVPIGLQMGSALVAARPIPASLVALIIEFGVVGAICGLGTLVLARRVGAPDSPTMSRPTPTRAIDSEAPSLERGLRGVRERVRSWLTPLKLSPVLDSSSITHAAR